MAQAVLAPPGRTDATLDAAIERFERFSSGLVRLEPAPLDTVRSEIDRFALELERHLAVKPRRRRMGAGGGSPTPRLELLGREHDRFRTSVEELRGILEVVAADDHGGHRQALGQYGRILAEALRLHRVDEKARGRDRGPRGGPGQA
ncbi:MAG TPA: hypothetical protein VMI55_00940 [Thermoplasmata archaeon]|nr:hypothetical protein [Thermoplasmata archaeon]